MNTDAAPAFGGGRVCLHYDRCGTVVLAGGGLGQIRAGQHIQVGTAGLQSEQVLRRRAKGRDISGVPQGTFAAFLEFAGV